MGAGPGRFCQSLVSVEADKAVHSAVKQLHCAGKEPISVTIKLKKINPKVIFGLVALQAAD
jgi:hypothetical protein